MRFFEFKLPTPGSSFDIELKQHLLTLVNDAKKLPETDPKRLKFNQFLQNIKAEAGISEDPVADVNQETVNAVLAFLAKKGVKEATMYLMDGAKILGDKEVQAALQKKGEVHASIGKETEFSTSKGILDQLKSSAGMLAAKISGTLEALKQQYDEQIREGDPQAPKRQSKPPKEINRELVDLIESIFNKPIGRANTIQQRDEVSKKILNFMKRCEVGVIDLQEKITVGKGKITSGINSEDQEILDMLENALMKAKPGKTAGNWGPGELGLAILGTPVNKGSKGDLDVGGEMIELKASQNPKKGGRFGSTALQRGVDGKAEYTKALNQLLTTAGYKPKQMLDKSNPNYVGNIPAAKGKTKQISHLSFGQTFIDAGLNPKLQGKVSQEDTLNFLETVAISCITSEYKTKISTRSLFKSSANSDGTINISVFNLKYSQMLYSLYQQTDDVGKIMVMNPITGDYFVLTGPKDLTVAAKGDGKNAPIQFSTVIIDFSDSQGKASPQIGI